MLLVITNNNIDRYIIDCPRIIKQKKMDAQDPNTVISNTLH